MSSVLSERLGCCSGSSSPGIHATEEQVGCAEYCAVDRIGPHSCVTLGSAVGRNTQNFNRAVFHPVYFYSVSDTKSSVAPSKEGDKMLCFSASGLTAHVRVSGVLPVLWPRYLPFGFTQCISRSGDQ